MNSLKKEFPPRAANQATLANWRTAPFNGWAFHHVREIVPSADIPNDPARALAPAVEPLDMRALRITADRGEISLDSFLEETDTDGFVVFHRGRIAFERYANGMAAET